MSVSPVRFAVAASGALACVMVGLVAGVRAGTNQTAHVMSVQTVTRTVGGHPQAAAARTVTHTVTRAVHNTVTVTATDTAQGRGPGGRGHKPKPPHRHGHRPGDGHGPGSGDHHGPGDGEGDGGGDGG
jgi:hypothetical protein